MDQFLEMIRAAFAGVVALFGVGAGSDAPLFYGYAEGEYARIAPREGGTLQMLKVARGEQVLSGQLLYVLESDNEIASRDDLRARLAQAEAQHENLRKGRRAPEVDALIAQRAQAEAAAKLSSAQLQRQERLSTSSAFSQERFDEARSAAERDRARVAELTAQISVARLSARSDEIVAAEAMVTAAGAALRQADWRLAQRTLVAPNDALVTDTYFVTGEYVPAGTPVVALLPVGNTKLRFYVPETMLGRLKIGQAVSVGCDGCPQSLAAKISYIAPQAEYAPPVIYSRETRAKLVYLVEARPETGSLFNPGQPVEIHLARAHVP